jgi:hypothetical protein
MGNNLKPVGSEKLQGMEKIQRIMEIARYKENIPNPINEDKSTEYTKTLEDGKNYQIVKEKNGYVIKRTISESTKEYDYLEPMKNRKYYPSYSQALKRLNLVTKEVNINEGQDKNINLFYENADNAATKYILKMKGGETDEQVAPGQVPAAAPAPAPAPSPAPAPVPTPSPEGGDMLPDDTELPIGDDDMEEDDNEPVTLKTIQKLTGKLAQKLRTFQEDEQGEEEMSSKDTKYVINSILSALDLESMDEEDKEEIVSKFEGGEDLYQDMGDDELAPEEDMGDDELAPEQGEMGEGFGYDDVDEDNPDDFDDVSRLFPDDYDEDEDEYDGLGIPDDMPSYKTKWDNGDSKPRQPKHRINHPHIESHHAGHIEDMLENLFTESKVDSILKGYFKVDENEKKLIESKKKQTKLLSENKKNKINKIKQLSESISQEVGARKLMEKYPNAKLVGKTNRQNLVFEMNDEQLRVNTKGQII